MADAGFLSVLVKSLARDVEERKEAVGLLSSLSDLSAVRRRIGRIQGCIVMLVSICNGDYGVASHDATRLLNSLSSNSQYVLNMAEAGFFTPLVHYLKEGKARMCFLILCILNCWNFKLKLLLMNSLLRLHSDDFIIQDFLLLRRKEFEFQTFEFEGMYFAFLTFRVFNFFKMAQLKII